MLLTKRAPRDPPAPRRGTRKRKTLSGDTTETSNEGNLATAPDDETGNHIQDLAAAIAMDRLKSPSTSQVASSAPSDLPGKETSETGDGEKARKKPGIRNVGGWVSPHFGSNVDRSWMEIDAYEKEFDHRTYCPQAGEVVL